MRDTDWLMQAERRHNLASFRKQPKEPRRRAPKFTQQQMTIALAVVAKQEEKARR